MQVRGYGDKCWTPSPKARNPIDRTAQAAQSLVLSGILPIRWWRLRVNARAIGDEIPVPTNPNRGLSSVAWFLGHVGDVKE